MRCCGAAGSADGGHRGGHLAQADEVLHPISQREPLHLLRDDQRHPLPQQGGEPLERAERNDVRPLDAKHLLRATNRVHLRAVSRCRRGAQQLSNGLEGLRRQRSGQPLEDYPLSRLAHAARLAVRRRRHGVQLTRWTWPGPPVQTLWPRRGVPMLHHHSCARARPHRSEVRCRGASVTRRRVSGRERLLEVGVQRRLVRDSRRA